MGNQHDCQIELAVNVEQKLQDRFGRLRVESRCRFVAQQNFRIGGECPGNAYPLLLPAGQLGRIGVCLVRQTDEAQQVFYLALDNVLWHSVHPQYFRHVVKDVVGGKQIEVLKNNADLFARLAQLFFLQLKQILPVDDYGAARRLFQQVDRAEQGTFPRSAKADHAVDLPFSTFRDTPFKASTCLAPTLYVL